MDTNLKGYNNVRVKPGVEERTGETQCFIHDRMEYLVRGTYKVCRVCGHAYQTADDLLGLWNAEQQRLFTDVKPIDFGEGVVVPTSKMKPVYLKSADSVPHCLLCLHDF